MRQGVPILSSNTQTKDTLKQAALLLRGGLIGRPSHRQRAKCITGGTKLTFV